MAPRSLSIVFGTPTTLMPALVQALGRPEGVLAADRDQAVDAVALEVGGDPLGPPLLLQRVGPRGAEDRAAARQDAPHLGDAERPPVALQRSPPAVAVADELVAVLGDALADDRPDHRVQPRAVAAAGEHAESHAAKIPAAAVPSPVSRRALRAAR